MLTETLFPLDRMIVHIYIDAMYLSYDVDTYQQSPNPSLVVGNFQPPTWVVVLCNKKSLLIHVVDAKQCCNLVRCAGEQRARKFEAVSLVLYRVKDGLVSMVKSF